MYIFVWVSITTDMASKVSLLGSILVLRSQDGWFPVHQFDTATRYLYDLSILTRETACCASPHSQILFLESEPSCASNTAAVRHPTTRACRRLCLETQVTLLPHFERGVASILWQCKCFRSFLERPKPAFGLVRYYARSGSPYSTLVLTSATRQFPLHRVA